ncbi:MAG: sigma-E processing peptidase SpoIIGA [Lachnospiraceae bacterium]|nr:sigma-E processing peptidase SpoIIGA [Lachnospiraceae bacterium]
MYYKLYIDSIFLLQMTSNLYLLSLAGRILGCTATHKRIWLGAMAGAGINCMAMIIPVGTMGIRLMMTAIPVSMGMLRITYREHSGKKLIHSSLVMACCGFFLGSIMIWLLNRIRMILKGRNSLFITIVIGYLAYVVLDRVIRWMQSRRDNCLREVRIYVPALKQEIRVKALVDTGNHLVEPVNGKPVSVVSEKLAQSMSSCFCPEKYHVVPYQSVGKERGILHAYELPCMIIEDHGNQVSKEHVIVAICNAGIPEESIYQMILHPRLLEN